MPVFDLAEDRLDGASSLGVVLLSLHGSQFRLASLRGGQMAQVTGATGIFTAHVPLVGDHRREQVQPGCLGPGEGVLADIAGVGQHGATRW